MSGESFCSLSCEEGDGCVGLWVRHIPETSEASCLESIIRAS